MDSRFVANRVLLAAWTFDLLWICCGFAVQLVVNKSTTNRTSCARGGTICPRPSHPPVGARAPRAPPSRRNVAVVSHAQYVLTVTAAPASCVKAAVSKAAW